MKYKYGDVLYSKGQSFISDTYPLDLFIFVKLDFVVYETIDKFSYFKYSLEPCRKKTLKFSNVSFIFSKKIKNKSGHRKYK
jgi:hypothetical protein